MNSKAAVGAEILRVADLIHLSRHELDSWVQEIYGKPSTKLTLPETQAFLDKLMGEAGRMGVSV